MDSNHRRLVPADLQSAPFDRFGTDPYKLTHCFFWSRCRDLNPRPFPYHGNALPTELQRPMKNDPSLVIFCVAHSVRPRRTFEYASAVLIRFLNLTKLNHFSMIQNINKWSRKWDLNPRPTVYKTVALPLSYFGLIH